MNSKVAVNAQSFETNQTHEIGFTYMGGTGTDYTTTSGTFSIAETTSQTKTSTSPINRSGVISDLSAINSGEFTRSNNHESKSEASISLLGVSMKCCCMMEQVKILRRLK